MKASGDDKGGVSEAGAVELHMNKKGLVAISRGCYHLTLPEATAPAPAPAKCTSNTHHYTHGDGDDQHHPRIIINDKATPSTQINSSDAPAA